MVLLKVTATINIAPENTVIVNPDVEELNRFSEVTMTKSNGTSHKFRLILSSGVPSGAIHMRKMESRIHRFHLGHTYHVKGVESTALFQIEPIVDFSRIKPAGYSSIITDIVENVFAPRKLSSELCNKMGLQFIRGVILYGPPGTGKMPLIKSLCEYFNIQPRIVHGPQLLKKHLGESEKAVRILFRKAIKDQKEKGDSSPLHVFVFNEMDAVFTKRTWGEGSSYARNGIVSQLSTIMDGYEPLNNILIFGTANRLDIIDPALLRGGRFELSFKLDIVK